MSQGDESQGGKANRRGDDVLSDVAHTIGTLAGCALVSNVRSLGALADAREQNARLFRGQHLGVFASRVHVGTDCFGKPLRLHFALWAHHWAKPLALFVQSQEGSGSAENKLCRMVINAHRRYCPVKAAFVLVGDGLVKQPGVLDFLHRQVNAPGRNILRVFLGADDLRVWATDGMAWPGDPQATFA